MEHFSEQILADFVRGAGAPVHTELESHLASKCPQCTRAVQVWSQMHAFAVRESSYCPPTEAVRMVKVEFKASRVWDDAPPANLIFHSFSQLAPAGVRSAGAPAARQMVYEVEGMMVDLHFEGSPGSKCISLIGQVLDQRAPRTSFANAYVMLWNDKGFVLAETRTNGLGEFALELEVQGRLRLSIQTVSGKLIRIPLIELSPEREGEGRTEGTGAGYP